jgi:hypothetical protein
MKKCPSCLQLIQDEAGIFCTYCGRRLTRSASPAVVSSGGTSVPPQGNKDGWLLAGFTAFIIFVLMLSSLNRGVKQGEGPAENNVNDSASLQSTVKSVPAYETVQERDLGGGLRFEVRVRLAAHYSEADVRTVARDVIGRLAARESVRKLFMFMYGRCQRNV